MAAGRSGRPVPRPGGLRRARASRRSPAPPARPQVLVPRTHA